MDLEKVSNASADTGVDMPELYNSWKAVVWVIRIKYTGFESFGTAFSVSSNGLILTCAHLFPKTSYTIDVRRFDEIDFHSAKVVYEKSEWDVALLQVIDVNDCLYAMLANGSLSVGQTLLHIGNPKNLVGSFLKGRVAFECIDNVKIPLTRVTCKDYTPTALTTTPTYRVMGDVWNGEVLGRSPAGSSFEKYSFEKYLHPLVPIIQMYDLICGKGCSGGPVFNVRGEIVGMIVMGAGGYEIAIHVAILREILRLFKEQHLDDEDGKRKRYTRS